MGNSLITKNFDLSKEHSANAGHLGLWKIYSGFKKGTAENELSIWTMQKDELSKKKPVPVTDKALGEQLFQIMRRDMITLSELNCEGFLKVVEVGSSQFALLSLLHCA